MGLAPLPEIKDPQGLQAALDDRYHIEIPVNQWGGSALYPALHPGL